MPLWSNVMETQRAGTSSCNQSLIKVALASEVINSLIRLERLIDYMWTRNLCFCRLVALRNAELDS